jgi:50S ribosomal protein L16 3-hydroxylase
LYFHNDGILRESLHKPTEVSFNRAMKHILSSPYKPPEVPQPLPINQAWALLGGISPKRFMNEYWQKKPLLVRGAIPAFKLAQAAGQRLTSPLSFSDLQSLAGQNNVESRLVKSQPWTLSRSRHKNNTIPSIDQPDWTLLVQGVNAHHSAASTVMSWFRFIPEARLDDLMISIAGNGGGVGPHVDSYDVFLLQMEGRRHWKISSQKDLSFKEDLPLKILKNFKASDDWVLEPGDMLYLPPNIAHDGLALDGGCQTWSIGFRSPNYKELVNEILWRTTEALESNSTLTELYKDPSQKATLDPALVPEQLVEAVQKHLNQLKWSKSDISCTLASILSEPKPQTVFSPPHTLLDLPSFKKAISQSGMILAPASKSLYDMDFFYLNGESVSDSDEPDWIYWCQLGQHQQLSALQSMKLSKLIKSQDDPWFEAYQAGWLYIKT